ncbi:RHS repeat-associated core domain-containing protein [Lachnospiraceae bacterium MD308]|nr:RHS repeat-associated core domain-containing protein [Lachnospiraceae bacterium MD308]
MNGSSAFQNEICYTGGIYDETTGLYYLNARYYDPENGRFLTEDTYRGELNEPDTLHLYVYCKNNPINYVDPSGHIVVEIALSYYAGAAIVSAGLVLYYSNLARIRGKLVYIYKERPARKKKYSAKAVMPKAGASIKKKVNINKSKSKVKSGTASKKASKKSKKERSTNFPSWAAGSEPRTGESGKEYAKRKMDEHYGKNGWRRKGKQASEYSQLKKWGDRGRK